MERRLKTVFKVTIKNLLIIFLCCTQYLVPFGCKAKEMFTRTYTKAAKTFGQIFRLFQFLTAGNRDIDEWF